MIFEYGFYKCGVFVVVFLIWVGISFVDKKVYGVGMFMVCCKNKCGVVFFIGYINI